MMATPRRACVRAQKPCRRCCRRPPRADGPKTRTGYCMRRTQRLFAAAALIAFSGLLGGCSGGGFDPSDLMDWMDTKKKLPGDRKPVFPQGVPGLEQGVPRDLYKGAQQQDVPPPVEAVPPPEPPKSSKAAKSGKGRPPATAAAPAEMPAGEVDGEAQPEA